MRDLRRYVRDPYYWRRAVQRLVESVARTTHLETHLERLLADNQGPAEAGQWEGGGTPPGAGSTLLYVAPKFDYGNPARGYSYEENHFRPALAALGFSILCFDSLTAVRRLGRKVASDLLAELAFRFRPRLAFFVMFRDDFEEQAAAEVARLGCTTFNWFTDDHWRFESFSSRWAPRFTWAITTDPQAVDKYHARGIHNVIRSQWAVNHRLYRPLGGQRRYGVTFIGQPHGDRRRTLAQLQQAGIPVEAWGYGWPRGKVSTKQAVRIIDESDVNLNLSKASTRLEDQIKGRDFEVPACRGLLLTGNVQRLFEYYRPGEEILVYDSFDEMVTKIRWARAHPQEADRIREAGYRRVLAEHTYDRRFLEVFRRAGVLP